MVAALSACGGGSSSSSNFSSNVGAIAPTPVSAFAYSGRFIDSPVAGLTYTVGTRVGVTTAGGYFQYDYAGETIRFSIGEVQIGESKTAGEIHIYDLNTTQDEQFAGKNIRVAQLLQSLDQNNGKSDVILIPEKASIKKSNEFALSFTGTQDDFDSALRAFLKLVDVGGQFVSKEVAKSRADQYVTDLLAKCPLQIPASPDALSLPYLLPPTEN